MFLKEYDNWILEAKHRQSTLGSAIIRFKRPRVDHLVNNLAGLKREELVELEAVMRDYERALHTIFQPDAVHYFLLGNRDPQLHFHAIPRYRDEREFAGCLWKDSNFGHMPDMNASHQCDMQAIVKALKAALPDSETNTLFYFVRHGETDWNKQNTALGHVDISINADGLAQAQELKRLLSSLSFDMIVSSDLKRAYDTAHIVAEGRGQSIQQDSRIRSRDWGELTGKASTLLYITNPELFACVESTEAMEKRIFHFLEEFVATHSNKRVLVVCHGSIMRIIMSKILRFVLEGVIVVPNTAWLKLSHCRNSWNLEEIKDIQLPKNLRFMR